MTDAREIIAEKIQEFRDPSPDGYISGVTYSFADDLMDALTAAGFRILGPDEVEDVRRVVEIANRNEWSVEGDRLARALGRKA